VIQKIYAKQEKGVLVPPLLYFVVGAFLAVVVLFFLPAFIYHYDIRHRAGLTTGIAFALVVLFWPALIAFPLVLIIVRKR